MKLAAIAAAIMLLFSCSEPMKQGKVVFISVAIDYGAPDGANALDNPPEDQRVLSEQIEALASASGELYEEHLFLEKNGIRSISGNEMKWNHDDILDLLSSLDTVSTDLVILHYSGHGDDDGSLVTDMDTSVRLSPERLLDALEAVDGVKCIFLDSCHSGAFIDGSPTMHGGEAFVDDELSGEGLIGSLLPSLAAAFSPHEDGRDGIWVLSAATADQSSFDSWDSEEPNQESFGAFSYYLASALGYDMEMDEPTIPGRGGRITFYGLCSSIRRSMAPDLRAKATPQSTLSRLDPVLFSF